MYLGRRLVSRLVAASERFEILRDSGNISVEAMPFDTLIPICLKRFAGEIRDRRHCKIKHYDKR